VSTGLRIRFSKHGKIRFTSHRDVARIWERALRRAELPIAYTEGYSPRPKLSFGLALSTGYESHGEYLDVALRDALGAVEINELPRRLAPVLPEGIEVQAVVALQAGATSLQQAVTSCTWHIEVGSALPSAVAHAMAGALAAPERVVTRQRKGRNVTDDVRPAILKAEVLGGTTIEAELATQPRGLRPAEFLAAVDPAWRASRVTRIKQWTQVGGARREVIDLPPAATPPPHAEVRAS
jgi:radical SAM-linked protein